MTESITSNGTLANSDTRRRVWAIVSASSGNLVEWFDFYVYSFCSLYFAHIFFPSGNTTTQLLQTAGVFAAGFLMRPIGGWLFGRIADSRKVFENEHRIPAVMVDECLRRLMVHISHPAVLSSGDTF